MYNNPYNFHPNFLPPGPGPRPYPNQPSMIPLQYFPSQISFMFYPGLLKDLPTAPNGEIPPDVVMSIISPRTSVGPRSFVATRSEVPKMLNGSYVL